MADGQQESSKSMDNEVEMREAKEYWGELIQTDKTCSDLLKRLLTAVAKYISTNFNPTDGSDITTTQMATYYKAVGGDFDGLFLSTPPKDVAFIYRSLGCLHSIQPNSSNDDYAKPNIPALKPKGFATWQTINLLLAPEEHVPFLQRTLREFDIVDPMTDSPFPKILPAECLPTAPDEAMLLWYQTVSQTLKKEAERQERKLKGKLDSSAGEGSASSGDDGHGAAGYFSNPTYKDSNGRPTIVRHYSRVAGRSPGYFQRGREVVSTVRHFISPRHLVHNHISSRRKSWHAESVSSDSEPPRPSTHAHRPREHRKRTPSPASSINPDHPLARPVRAERRQSHQRSPNRLSPHDSARPSRSASPATHVRIQEPTPPRAVPEREYFPDYREDSYPLRRHSSAQPAGSPPRTGFAPSMEAPFATRVSQLQQSTSRTSTHEGRSRPERSGSYGRSNGGRSTGESRNGRSRNGDESPRYASKVRERSRHSTSRSRDGRDEEFREKARRSRSHDDERYGEGGARYDGERKERRKTGERDRDRVRDRVRERERDSTRRYRERDGEVSGVDGRRYPDRSYA